MEGADEVGSAHRSELTIDTDLVRLSAREIGFPVEDGKAITARLLREVVTHQCETYDLMGPLPHGLPDGQMRMHSGKAGEMTPMPPGSRRGLSRCHSIEREASR